VIADARALPDEVRWRAADRALAAAKSGRDIALPPLARWNASPCGAHAQPDPACRACGIVLKSHQRSGTAWMYLAGHGLLADTMGSGKTHQVAAVGAWCLETGEIGLHSRMVIVARAPAVAQWAAELRRAIPDLAVIAPEGGSPAKRTEAYLSAWECCVVSGQVLLRDLDALRQFPVGMLVYDDADAMRNRDNATAYAIRQLAGRAQRVYGVHATPAQKRLLELYSFLEPLGGREMFGSPKMFAHQHVREETTVTWVRDDEVGRQVRREVKKEAGARNPEQLRRMIAPLVLRRTDFADLPALVPSQQWLDLSPAQRARYKELRAGVLRRIREDGDRITRPDALAQFLHGAQICCGLMCLDGADGPGASAKLDWTVDAVTGDLAEEKVVCFVWFRPAAAALARRLEAAGVGTVLLRGGDGSPRKRAAGLERFRDDPSCRVLVGTATMEASLNLQVARHMIWIDTIMNPQRMHQVAGRIRRQGSRFSTVFVHHLLTRGTQEESYPARLAAEQAMSDAVWGESSDMFPSLSSRELLEMVAA
jgi:SNF2 family DNA or RNA helicase